jgi:septal ring factor EnvC (AmiA/AmiB activator)
VQKKYWIYFFAFFFSLVFNWDSAFAQKGVARQKKAALEEQRRQTEEDIAITKKLLEETRKNRKASINEVTLLKKQISLREKLLADLNSEIYALQEDIEETGVMVTTMEGDISKLKAEYSDIARLTAQKTRPVSVLLWIFSAESFYQAFQRILFFREFSRYRKNQILLIRRTQKFLSRKNHELTTKRSEKLYLISSEKKESDDLLAARKEKDNAVKELAQKESEYKKVLAQKRKDLAMLNAEIDRLIKESIRESKSSSTTRKNEEADIINPLSSQFEKNKGNLPWPVPSNEGVITGDFGIQVDKDGLETNNHGIYIATPENAVVRAVFGGTVTRVGSILQFGKVVIIEHGNYRTVYANLKDSKVKPGQKIEALEEIGTVKTDPETGETEVHFQLYRDKTPVDPGEWIVKKRS